MKRLLAIIFFLFGFGAIAHAGDGDCIKKSSICLDATPCKQMSGIDVCLSSIGETCWKYEDVYTCVDPTQVDDCQPLRDRGCGQIGSKCITRSASGACTNYEQTYQCETTGGSTSTVMDCGTQTFCMSGNCFDSGHAPDTDFAKTITAMEAAREAGTYMDPDNMQLFRGFDNRCRKGYFGLKSCCKTSGGGAAMSNSSTLGSVAMSAAGSTGGEALRYGSTYVYDALYTADSSSIFTQGLGAMLNQDGPASTSFDPSLSFGMYGLTFTTGTMPLTTMGLANTSLATQTGIQGLYFSPATFYIAIAVMIIQELMSCEPEEQVLGMKLGQNLCHFVGSYCSNEVELFSNKMCLETTESYCCYNSRLARIINEQGRPQIGKSWGTGESPNCSGFTPDQLQALDFSAMNLSEFYAEILPKTPDANAIQAKNQLLVQQKVNDYYNGSAPTPTGDQSGGGQYGITNNTVTPRTGNDKKFISIKTTESYSFAFTTGALGEIGQMSTNYSSTAQYISISKNPGDYAFALEAAHCAVQGSPPLLYYRVGSGTVSWQCILEPNTKYYFNVRNSSRDPTTHEFTNLCPDTCTFLIF